MQQLNLFGEIETDIIKQKKIVQEKSVFESELNRLSQDRPRAIYYNFCLKHNGITSYKVFDGYSRNVSSKSMSNLLSTAYSNLNVFGNSLNFDESLGYMSKEELNTRTISKKQSMSIKKYANKLNYYSSERVFESKKSGKYKMKIAFLTLTCPVSANIEQRLKAFDHFLDYLRRTANAVYVWKKEIGSKSNQLHFHVMLNNFIPYYIVSWKWKRLLLNEGVEWPVNENGKHTDSHYKIELPRKAKVVSSYIAKYMAKDEVLPKCFGYLWGKSKVLDECKELTLMEGEVKNDELFEIYKKYKIVGDSFVKHVCCDLLKVDKIAPEIFSLFEKQFYAFQSLISLPSRFQYC